MGIEGFIKTFQSPPINKKKKISNTLSQGVKKGNQLSL